MSEFTIDAQKIPGPQRHAYIFECLDNLQGGESLIVLNTHDPKPLLYQLSESRKDQFKHQYLEEGPQVWRVKITKNQGESCCGFCGG